MSLYVKEIQLPQFLLASKVLHAARESSHGVTYSQRLKYITTVGKCISVPVNTSNVKLKCLRDEGERN